MSSCSRSLPHSLASFSLRRHASPLYLVDILYISVRLLAPCKSIFALPPESNLSVSSGIGASDRRQDRKMLLNTKRSRSRIAFRRQLREYLFMKSVSKDAVV